MSEAVLVCVMAAVTFGLRALPFLIFRGRTPKYISYLGEVLPPAIIGMLPEGYSDFIRPFRASRTDCHGLRGRTAGVETQFAGQHPRRNDCLYAADPGCFLEIQILWGKAAMAKLLTPFGIETKGYQR